MLSAVTDPALAAILQRRRLLSEPHEATAPAVAVESPAVAVRPGIVQEALAAIEERRAEPLEPPKAVQCFDMATDSESEDAEQCHPIAQSSASTGDEDLASTEVEERCRPTFCSQGMADVSKLMRGLTWQSTAGDLRTALHELLPSSPLLLRRVTGSGAPTFVPLNDADALSAVLGNVEDLVLRNCFVVERVDNTWPNSPDRQENELTLENELSVEMESDATKALTELDEKEMDAAEASPVPEPEPNSLETPKEPEPEQSLAEAAEEVLVQDDARPEPLQVEQTPHVLTPRPEKRKGVPMCVSLLSMQSPDQPAMKLDMTSKSSIADLRAEVKLAFDMDERTAKRLRFLRKRGTCYVSFKETECVREKIFLHDPDIRALSGLKLHNFSGTVGGSSTTTETGGLQHSLPEGVDAFMREFMLHTFARMNQDELASWNALPKFVIWTIWFDILSSPFFRKCMEGKFRETLFGPNFDRKASIHFAKEDPVLREYAFHKRQLISVWFQGDAGTEASPAFTSAEEAKEDVQEVCEPPSAPQVSSPYGFFDFDELDEAEGR